MRAPVVGRAVNICTGRESMIVRSRLSDGGGISRTSGMDAFRVWVGGAGALPGVVAAGSD